MASDKHAGPMRNAEASLRMEGLIVTPQMRERCVEVLEGRATTEECLRQIAAKDPAVRDALASARIEGLEVTEHTERDVARILSGEATAQEVAREILRRPASSAESDK
jgi:23S rRNA U2552 (ribose-2'-O)-methylase RlmE/FtsJ